MREQAKKSTEGNKIVQKLAPLCASPCLVSSRFPASLSSQLARFLLLLFLFFLVFLFLLITGHGKHLQVFHLPGVLLMGLLKMEIQNKTT